MRNIRILRSISQHIRPKDLFTSARMTRYFTELAKMVSERYDVPLRVHPVWSPEENNVAYTNNSQIHINLANPITMGIGRRTNYDKQTMLLTYLGLEGHELGHALCTDFQDVIRLGKAWRQRRWYPWRPKFKETVYEKTVRDVETCVFSSPAFAQTLLKLFKEVSNICEDGYIEHFICREYRGTFREGIGLLNGEMFRNEKDDEKKSDGLGKLLNLMLYAAKMGKYPPAPEFPFLDDIYSRVRKINFMDDVSEREAVYVEIFVILLSAEDFEPLKKQLGALEQNKQNRGSQRGTGTGGLAQRQIQVRSIACQKNQRQQAGSQPLKNGGKTKAEYQKGRKGGQKGNYEESFSPMKVSSESGERGTQKTGSEQQKEKGRKDSPKWKNDGLKNLSDNSGNSGGKSCRKVGCTGPESKERKGRKSGSDFPEFRDALPDNPYSGLIHKTPIQESDFDGGPLDSFPASEEILQNVISTYLDHHQELNLQSISLDISETAACHADEKSRVRIPEITNKNRSDYDAINSGIRACSKKMQRFVKDALDDREEGGRMNGLLMGNRILPAYEAHRNGRIFSRETMPEDIPPIAVCLLVDESGSMAGLKTAKSLETAVLLEDFCRGLSLPLAVVGHSEVGYHLTLLNHYVDFEGKPNQKYRLTNMAAHGCNRDGFALRYCMKLLQRRPEEQRLLILISDGQPSSAGYTGKTAYADLKSAKRECSKFGITLVAAAIDEDREQIKAIYGADCFLNITDLDKMPEQMVRIVLKMVQ